MVRVRLGYTMAICLVLQHQVSTHHEENGKTGSLYFCTIWFPLPAPNQLSLVEVDFSPAICLEPFAILHHGQLTYTACANLHTLPRMFVLASWCQNEMINVYWWSWSCHTATVWICYSFFVHPNRLAKWHCNSSLTYGYVYKDRHVVLCTTTGSLSMSLLVSLSLQLHRSDFRMSNCTEVTSECPTAQKWLQNVYVSTVL